MFGSANPNPAQPSCETLRLERDDGYDLALLRRNLNGVDDLVHCDVDGIRIGGTDIVAELGVTVARISMVSRATLRGGQRCLRVRDCEGEESALFREDEGISRSIAFQR